jgi:hypothetical protein
MEKDADILVLKWFCSIDGPFGKTLKNQGNASGGHAAHAPS